MFLRIILIGFFLYILYRFVFEFLVPVIKTTQHIKKGFREMNKQANEQMKATKAQSANTNNSTSVEKNKEPIGDYIDFEEIK